MRKLRLRRIATVNFVRSELTNFMGLLQEHPELRNLKAGDVVLLRSTSGDQLAFIHGFQEAWSGKKGDATKVMYLHSVRLRLLKGSWNSLMIADYAKRVGIELEGLPTFDKHLQRILKDGFPEAPIEEIQEAVKKARQLGVVKVEKK